MPRRPRKDIVEPGIPHLIGMRGNNRRRLFSYTADYQRFLDYFFESKIEHRVDLHQLTLMPNHSHIVATPPEADSLSKFMGICQQRYARYRNHRRAGTGRLFEERFWCTPLRTPEDVEAATLYSDANAMKAAMVAHPADHVWSTCAIHYGQPERSRIPVEWWTPSDWYLSLGPDAPIVYEQRMAAFLTGRIPAWCHERMLALESMASLDYRGRVERPDGSSAR